MGETKLSLFVTNGEKRCLITVNNPQQVHSILTEIAKNYPEYSPQIKSAMNRGEEEYEID